MPQNLPLPCIAILALLSCFSDPPRGSEADASPAAKTDASSDQRPAYDPALVYDLESIMDLSAYELVVADDKIEDVGGGRFVRSLLFGIGSGGYPMADTVFGIGGQLFVESNASGEPIGDTSSVALALYSGVARPGFTVDCALLTGVVCVVADKNVLGPSELSPRYTNEFDSDSAAIENSNVLFFNMLSEMRRGSTANGESLTGLPVRREYVVNISEASMRLVSATQKVLSEHLLVAAPPERFVVTGHSKWGAAAAQLAAVDPRVIGASVAGWTIDWLRWVQLAQEHWLGELGLDAWAFFCGSKTELCEWTDTQRFASFIQSTVDNPETCGTAPCVGTGEHFLRQVDLRHLIEAGAFAGKALALVRNGREAHQIELESRAFEEGVTVEQFLLLPEGNHVQNTEPHSRFWRHWVRHVLKAAPTPRLIDLQAEFVNRGFSVSASVENAASIVGAELWLRPSYDGSFGSLDAIPDYKELCGSGAGCSEWQSWPLAVDGAVVGAGPLELGLAPDTELAYLIQVTFDDGSGDTATVSTAAQFTSVP